MATGCLSASTTPDIPRREIFQGPTYHTCGWPKDGVDFSGQRVAIIGTGSSGVQVIPEIAQQTKNLTVFQRTPNFVLPAHNHALDPEDLRSVKANYAEVRKANRESGFGIAVPTAGCSALEVTDEERHAFYDRVWNDPDSQLVSMLNGYTDLLTRRPGCTW